MNSKLYNWLQSYKFLPQDLQDFHIQKNLFKYLDQFRNSKIFQGQPINYPEWTSAHVYVIDVFLFIMAKHGYTLQKSKAKVPFKNLTETLRNEKQTEIVQIQEWLENNKNT